MPSLARRLRSGRHEGKTVVDGALELVVGRREGDGETKGVQ